MIRSAMRIVAVLRLLDEPAPDQRSQTRRRGKDHRWGIGPLVGTEHLRPVLLYCWQVDRAYQAGNSDTARSAGQCSRAHRHVLLCRRQESAQRGQSKRGYVAVVDRPIIVDRPSVTALTPGEVKACGSSTEEADLQWGIDMGTGSCCDILERLAGRAIGSAGVTDVDLRVAEQTTQIWWI
jgi:hypothetical protein